MDNSVFTKIVNSFSILFCTFLTLTALLLMFFPFEGFILRPPFTNEDFFSRTAFLSIIGIVVFMPSAIALVGYYLAGGIGKNWFSHLLAVFTFFMFVIFGFVLIYVLFVYFTTEVTETNYAEEIMGSGLWAFVITLGVICRLVLPLTYMITSLIVQKVSLWKRLLPLVSLILTLLLSVVLGAFVYIIGSVTGSEMIYYGFRDATPTHWFMLGSIGWGLLNIIAFTKRNEAKVDDSNPFENPNLSLSSQT